MATRNRVCGEQDCKRRVSKPSHSLCYIDYLEFRDGLINECANHPGVYKPSEFDVCLSCYSRKRKAPEKTQEGRRTRPSSDAKGWDNPYRDAKVVSPYAKAVQRVRTNMSNHSEECVNHESNTIQYLVEPMLRGLGWDFDDPEQVMREYRPKGDQGRGKRGEAVDIALLENRTPTVFVEVKRLDRDHTPEYEKQIERYASHMKMGTAVLTNGKYWIVRPVLQGSFQGQSIIDVSQGDPEQVGKELLSVIGMNAKEKGNGKSVRPSDLTDSLSDYRLRESKRRNVRAYTIFTDRVIELIAFEKPNSLEELATIKGVGPATLKAHGVAILKIVKG